MPPPEKSFLVQKFSKLSFGPYSIIGYSVAGEESVVQVPELSVCFDIGRCPYFALTSNIVCITHGHMDHIAGLPYYLSQRYFQGMQPGTILLPADLQKPVDAMLRCWRDVERQGTPYKLVPMEPGAMHYVRKDFAVKAFATHHGPSSLGYALISVRLKLKPEFLSLTGPQIIALREKGTQIQYRLDVPLVAYLGDTSFGPVFSDPDVQTAQFLITEVTFFDQEHKTKAKAGKHLHLDQFAEILPTLKNEQIILMHVSRRLGIKKAKRILTKRIPPDQLPRLHFLMDFEDAQDAGDIEAAGPPPADAAE